MRNILKPTWYYVTSLVVVLGLLISSPTYAQLTAEEYYHRGIRYIQNGNLEAALEDFNACIRFNSDYADAYYNRAYIYTKLNDFELALQDYDKTIELDTKNADYLLMRGNAYYFLDKYPQALLDYTRAIEMDTNNAQSYFYRGIALLETDDYGAGCDDLKVAASKGFFYAKRALIEHCGGD